MDLLKVGVWTAMHAVPRRAAKRGDFCRIGVQLTIAALTAAVLQIGRRGHAQADITRSSSQ